MLMFRDITQLHYLSWLLLDGRNTATSFPTSGLAAITLCLFSSSFLAVASWPWPPVGRTGTALSPGPRGGARQMRGRIVWPKRQPRAEYTASRTRSGGRPASLIFPGGPPRAEPGPPPSGSGIICVRSAGIILRGFRASAAGFFSGSGGRQPSGTTSCCRTTLR